MGRHAWLLVGSGLDLVVLLAGFYMAISAVDVVSRSDRSPYAIGVGLLFLALPVLAILAPLSAWRAAKRGRPGSRIATLFAAPWVYGAFLIVFLKYA
ncbi:MAG TPA: hypothetical protein VGM72_00225 [Micropepsaceae bacterium]|jgi:hypothetical protein